MNHFTFPVISLLFFFRWPYQFPLAPHLDAPALKAAGRWTARHTSGVKRKGSASSFAAWWKLKVSTGLSCAWWASTLSAWPSYIMTNLSGWPEPSVSDLQMSSNVITTIVSALIKSFVYDPTPRHSRVGVSGPVSDGDDAEDVRPRSEELLPLVLQLLWFWGKLLPAW